MRIQLVWHTLARALRSRGDKGANDKEANLLGIQSRIVILDCLKRNSG